MIGAAQDNNAAPFWLLLHKVPQGNANDIAHRERFGKIRSIVNHQLTIDIKVKNAGQ
tara:strand:- start:740 stop:910 length:171 start_codon:yes stop_codon:yes gene_type:complete